MKESITERLEAKSIPEPNSGCLLWTGVVDTSGYGRIGIDGGYKGAHRIAFEQATGRPIPTGMHVLHKCDVRSCINPDHLWLGTNLDNMRDRDRKGRCFRIAPDGEANPQSKLTEDMVRVILSSPDRMARKLALKFGVSTRSIYYVRSRKTWAHLPPP